MAEIRRAPVEVGSLSHYLRRVLYIPGGDRRISEPSTASSPVHQILEQIRKIIPKRPKPELVGGFNPLEKYARQNG